MVVTSFTPGPAIDLKATELTFDQSAAWSNCPGPPPSAAPDTKREEMARFATINRRNRVTELIANVGAISVLFCVVASTFFLLAWMLYALFAEIGQWNIVEVMNAIAGARIANA